MHSDKKMLAAVTLTGVLAWMGGAGVNSTVQGHHADGDAVTANPVIIGGKDGSSNAQDILVDTSGRLAAIGAASDGAAVAGNPLLIAGQDGTNAQSLITDSTGALGIAGIDSRSVLSQLSINAGDELLVERDGIAAVATNTFAADWQAVAAAGGVRFHGFSVREGSSAAAEFHIYDGTDATGTLLEAVTLAADGSAQVFYERGIDAANGIWVDFISGDPGYISIRYRTIND